MIELFESFPKEAKVLIAVTSCTLSVVFFILTAIWLTGGFDPTTPEKCATGIYKAYEMKQGDYSTLTIICNDGHTFYP